MRYFVTTILLFGSYFLSAQVYQPGRNYVSFAIGVGGDAPNRLWISDEVTGANTATETSYELRTPPIALAFNYQYGLHEYVSVGAYVSSSTSTADLMGFTTRLLRVRGDYDGDGRADDVFTEQVSEKRQLTSVYFGVKGEFHFAEFLDIEQTWDLYTGLSVGGNYQRERVFQRESVAITELDFETPNEVTSRETTSNPSYFWDPDPNDIDGNFFLGARYFSQENWGLYLEGGLYYRYVQVGAVFTFDGMLPFGL